MASPLVPSALDPSTQTFPKLTAEQIERIRIHGRARHVERGEILFKPDDVGVPFFVLLSGGLEIVQPTYEGERPVTTHSPGQFTGEMTMITGQRCLVLGRVSEAGEFLELSGDELRSLVAKDAELSEVLMRAFILRRLELIRHGFGNVTLLGSRHSAQTLDVREFLTRNNQPFSYIDLDTDRTFQEMLDRFSVQASEVPVVIFNTGEVMRNPSVPELAGRLGLNSDVDNAQIRDVIIVGAGPAGLAAAVYAASEGLEVLVIETNAPGGQAGSSSKIENYLGFPTGISGGELAARAVTQAQKFGAHVMIAHKVKKLECGRQPYRVVLETGDSLLARAIVIATGAHYNKPQLPNLEKFEGNGIYYGATYIESQLCGDDNVAVVGGGNSAGQAAVFLSQTTRRVHMLIRSSELRSTMSRYLIQRLAENPRIGLHFNTEITKLEGNGHLESLAWQDRNTGETSSHDIRHLFIMAGASPCTEWLRGCLALDEKGFILTGRDLDTLGENDGNPRWPLKRDPQMLETTLPGVFAVGDVRSGNVKRVASAVGEGAIAIHMVHRSLAEL